MKRILAIVLCVALALSALSCAFISGAKSNSTPIIKIGDKNDNDNKDGFETDPKPLDKINIATSQISGIVDKYYYGKAVTQNPTVKFNGTVLKKDTDYTLSYSNNNAIGKATVIIAGKGDYTGEVKKTFKINLAKPKVKVTNGTTWVKLSYAKVAGAKSYIIYQYNKSKKTYTTLAKVSALSYKITGKSPCTTYYFLVRATDGDHKSPYITSDNVKALTLCKAPSAKASVSGKTVTLKWAKISGAKYYRIYKYNASKNKYTTVLSKTTAISVKLSKQSKGTNYYLVRAFNANNAGSAYTTKNLTKAVIK